MNARLAMILCWCMCGSTALAAFTPDEARRVYGETSSSSESSILEVGDYVFMELKWDSAADASAEECEEQELSAMMDAIQEYVTPKQCAVTNSPFCKELTDWLLPECEFNVPDVASTTLKEEESNGERRVVVAFDAQGLRDAREAAEKTRMDLNSFSTEQWASALSGAYTNFKTKEEKRKFLYLLGCPVVGFLEKGIGFDKNGLSGRADKGSVELRKLMEWKPTKGSVFFDNPSLTWRFYKQLDSDMFFPAWSENDGGRLDEAAKLYRQGKDIPTIIRLLAESISMNPINATKWEYLGGVLKASNKPCDAVIAYIQALKINSKSPWAWKGLVDSLDKAGFKANAAGLRWYLKIKGN